MVPRRSTPRSDGHTAGLDHILVLCTGNATRSVITGAALRNHLDRIEVVTAGTLAVEGRPMSWRTRAGFAAVDLATPGHRSRQASPADLDRAGLIIGLAPEHVAWVRREHPAAASRAVTLRRLVRDLEPPGRPLGDRLAAMALDTVELEPWEEVVDPGGGEESAFVACAQQIVALVDSLAPRLTR